VKEKGFTLDQVRTLSVRYPPILGKTREDFDEYFGIMKGCKLDEKEAFYYLLEIPKLISKDLKANIKGINFYFYLYFRFKEDIVVSMFKEFPYIFCLNPEKILEHIKELKKYEFNDEETLHIIKKSGGLLASSTGTLSGIFDELTTKHNFSNEEIKTILWHYPEFVFQRKDNMLSQKVTLIK